MARGGRVKVLDAKEWARLEKVGQSITHQTIWALLRFTGCRSQEARLLKVDNVYVDPEKKILREMIYFPREIRKGKQADISVPITSKLRSYLENYRKFGFKAPSFSVAEDGFWMHFLLDGKRRQSGLGVSPSRGTAVQDRSASLFMV